MGESLGQFLINLYYIVEDRAFAIILEQHLCEVRVQFVLFALELIHNVLVHKETHVFHDHRLDLHRYVLFTVVLHGYQSVLVLQSHLIQVLQALTQSL